MSKSIHTLAIFLGAFLLFLVQPLMGKFILPWFGGGPGVWTTCLLFFQTLLLGGYAYAHLLTAHVPLRRQADLHLTLLVVALVLLPIIPKTTWQPEPGADPVGGILLLLLANVGLPYLLLSATGPLFQHWFSRLHQGASPYRLYALSNAGSLLALVGFPFLFEPLFSRRAMGWGWSVGLVVFTGLCGLNARLMRSATDATPTAAKPTQTKPAAETPAPTPQDRVLWLSLSAVASLLLAATTNKLCLDIAAMPFVWVLPLGVYLLSFILCFDHPRWYSRRWWSFGFALSGGGSVQVLSSATVPLPLQVAIHCLTLLGACMICHGELFRLKPAPQRLTGYYLTIATGGALGSIFVALLAPVLFDDYRELSVGLVLIALLTGIVCLLHRERSLGAGTVWGLVAATFLIAALQADASLAAWPWIAAWAQALITFYTSFSVPTGVLLVLAYLTLRQPRPRRDGFATKRVAVIPLLLPVLLGIVFINQVRKGRTNLEAAGRNFYGAYKLHVFGEKKAGHYYLLTHGGTTHGLQIHPPPYTTRPTTYYGAASGIGRTITSPGEPRRVGLIGLGTGTLAVYGRPGDTFRFYEIDPAIMKVAQEKFLFLQHSTAKIETVLGDARLVLEAELRQGRSQQFDLIVLDAFNGDAIPIHLLTQEAMHLYRRHLRPGGVIAVHISNRHLNLQPVVQALAVHSSMAFATVLDEVKVDDWWLFNSRWMILSNDADWLRNRGFLLDTPGPADAAGPHWTDDHASLFSALSLRPPSR